MSLDLPPRQRAMLQEMGVRVWLPPYSHADSAAATPQAASNPNPNATAQTSPQAPPSLAATPAWAALAPAPNHVINHSIKPPDWAALGQAIANCQACALSVGRRAPVWGGHAHAQEADFLVLGAPPNLNEETAGHPFASDEGVLLDNMLRVMGRRRGAPDRAQAAYVSNVVKCRPDTPRLPDATELATCETHLRHEIALVRPRVILTMGRLAALSLLRHNHPDALNQPLGQLRGRLYRYQNIAVVVTYPPNYLLRTSQAKAGAWADLCLAMGELARLQTASEGTSP